MSDELEQVVGADGQEVHLLHQLGHLPQQGRHLDHRAQLQPRRQEMGES